MKRLITVWTMLLCTIFIVTSQSNAEANLLQNPGFEELGWPPAYWSEWTGSSSGSPADGVAGYISDTVAHTGSQCVIRELYGRGIRWGGYSQDIDLSEGIMVTASGWLMSSSSDNPLKIGAEAYIELKFLDGNNNELSVYESSSLTGASSWVQHSIVQEAPAGTAKARFSFVLYGGVRVSAGKVYFDDAVIEVEGGDTTPPIVTITSPADQSTTETSPITVTGTVDDPIVTSIDVNGNIEPVSSGSWSSSVSLIEGSNIITATATDDAGNAGSGSITVYYGPDTIPPVVTIILPPDGTRTNSYPIEVTGTVDDPQVTSIDVNGAIEPVGNGSWSSYVSLAEGSNTITATAQDPSGNVGADSITVYLDTIAPVVTITSPQDQTTTEVSPITVSGTVDDLAITSIDVNGKIEAVSSGSWSSSVSLIEGSNIITATATDDAGNAGSDSITVYYNPPAPVNLLQNPGFEDSDWPPIYWSEWAGSGSGSPEDGVAGYLTPTSHTGTQSAARKLYGSGIRWGGYSQDIAINEWDLVTASGWLMSSTSDDPLANGAVAYIEIKFFDGSNEELGMYKSAPLTGASSWVHHTISKYAPATAAKARFSFVLVGDADNATGTVYFDDAYVEAIPGDKPQPDPFDKPQSTGPVKISGNTLLVDGEPFIIKGVCYQPVLVGYVPWEYDVYSDPDVYNRDLPILRDMGANTLRTYAKVTSTEFLDACYNNGVNPIYVVMGYYIDGSSDLSDPGVRDWIKTDFRSYVSTYKNHPAVLMWSPGNETEVAYAGCGYEHYTLLNELAEAAYIEEGSAYHPVTAVLMNIIDIGDSNLLTTDEYMNYLDVWGANVYEGITFGDMFDDYAGRSSKVFWVSEFGVDAWHTNDKYGDPADGYLDEVSQEQCDTALWDEIASRSDVCSGGTVFEYSDEWWKDQYGDNSVHDYGGFPYTYEMVAHPDEYSNEEWSGVVAVSDNGTGPDIVTLREAYYGLKSRWAESGPEPKMHIQDISMSLSSRAVFVKALATIIVYDENNQPVPGAIVSGSWSGLTSDSDSGETDSTGTVTLESDEVKKAQSGSQFTFTVTDVFLSGWTYDSVANIETSDSISVP